MLQTAKCGMRFAGMAFLLWSAAPSHAETITAGSPPSSAPTTFLDTKTGKISGFMYEAAEEIARREHFDLTFNAIQFAALIQSVVSGKIDMIVAGMTPTPKRAEVIDFSQPVTSFGEGIFVRDDNHATLTSARDFGGLVVGVPAGTDYGTALRAMNVAMEIKYYDSPADMARDVSLGRITLGMIDYPVLGAQEAAGALKGMHVVDDYKPMRKFDIAFGVKKGNTSLLDRINSALTSMKADGALDKLLTKWRMVQG